MHNLATGQVFRILECSAGGKRRIEYCCFLGKKNNRYVEDHLAAVNNSAQYPEELLVSGWGENEPLNATSNCSHGISGKSTCTHLAEKHFLVCLLSKLKPVTSMIGRVNCFILNEEIIFFGGAPGKKKKKKRLALCDKIN